MNSKSVLLIVLLVAATAPAVVTQIQVDGPDAIYLAGRTDVVVPPASDPWTGPGFYLARHLGPTPEEAQETHPECISVVGGATVQMAAPVTGGINFFNGFGPPYYSPDGNGASGSDLSSIDGISGYIGPQGPLAGVFLDDNIPDTGPAPATLDFTPGGLGTDFMSLTPELGQVFFIGDGYTSGADIQHFVAPAGATRMCLGIPDGFGFVGYPGAYDDNDGNYIVTLDVTVYADIDIKPGSCPNPFNAKSKGSVPVAIIGTDALDVTEIDPATITLNGVSALAAHYSIDDVTEPVDADEEDCFDCFDADANLNCDFWDLTDPQNPVIGQDGILDSYCGDGYPDLIVKFDTQELAASIGSVPRDTCVVLELTAETYGGIPVEGSDSVITRKKQGR